MKSILLLLFFIGSIFMTIGYVQDAQHCEPKQIEYRYVPKSFEQEQAEQMPVRAMFSQMFNEYSPWENSIGYASDYHIKKLYTYHEDQHDVQ